MTQMDLFAGRKARDEGIKKMISENGFVIDLIRNHARKISKEKGRVSADDLRTFAQTEGLTLRSHAWGAVFKQDGWTQIGWKQSEWESNHARVVRVWRWDGKL